MIDEGKIRLMTKAALIKQKEERRLFISRKFYASDYTLFHTIKAVIGMTMAYLVLIVLLFIDQSEELTTLYSVSNLISYIQAYGVIYAGLLIMTIIISLIYCAHRFSKSKEIIKDYQNTLKTLYKKYYKQKKQDKSVTTDIPVIKKIT